MCRERDQYGAASYVAGTQVRHGCPVSYGTARVCRGGWTGHPSHFTVLNIIAHSPRVPTSYVIISDPLPYRHTVDMQPFAQCVTSSRSLITNVIRSLSLSRNRRQETLSRAGKLLPMMSYGRDVTTSQYYDRNRTIN